MDSFFNDCLYAWDFLDSATGEIGGVGFDSSVVIGNYAGVLGSCATANGVANYTSSSLDVSGGDYLTFNMWISTNNASWYPAYLYFSNATKTSNFSIGLYNPDYTVQVFCAGYTTTPPINYKMPYYTTTPKAMLTFTIDKVNKTLSGYYNNHKMTFSGNDTMTISGFNDFGSFDNIWYRVGDVNSAQISCSLLRIWNKALTQDDIDYLYNNGTGRLLTMPDAKSIYEDCYAYYKLDETSGTTIYDATSNNRHGSIYGTNAANLTNSSGIIESCYKAMTTNDSGKYIAAGFNAGAFSGLTEATISYWIKPEQYSSNPSTSYALGGVCCGSLNYNNFNLVLRTERDMYAQYVKCVANIHTVNGTYTGAIGLTGGAWNHVVLVFKDDTAIVYVNGTLVWSYSTSGALYNSTQSVTIMTNPTGNSMSFLGEIDEIGFWQRGLSQLEAQVLYNGGQGLPFESGPTYLVELTDGVGVTDDVSTKTDYHVNIQEYGYTTDSEDINQDTTISLRDNVSTGDNVKVKVDYKVDIKEDLQTNDDQRVIVYKNGIDSIWTNRTKPDNTTWTNRPKPWIAK